MLSNTDSSDTALAPVIELRRRSSAEHPRSSPAVVGARAGAGRAYPIKLFVPDPAPKLAWPWRVATRLAIRWNQARPAMKGSRG